MARMYSRSKGKSSSSKPLEKKAPAWLRFKPQEIELLITKLAKKNKSASEIGLILRDSYGIPDVKLVTGKKITKILSEKKLTKELPEDLFSLIKKSVLIRKHLEKNHKDQPARRGLTLTDSKIKRLAKHFKETGRLPADWKFQPDKIKIFVE